MRPRLFHVVATAALAAALLASSTGCSSIPGLNAVFLPEAESPQQQGEPAPDFALPSAQGETVSLASLEEGGAAAVIVFYRAHW